MRKHILITALLFAMAILTACSSAGEPDNPLVGSAAPDFSLANTTGGQTTLSEFKGTPVLLFFHMAVG